GCQNDRRTIEATSQSTSESNKRNEQLIIDCAKHGSALDVDLTSESEFEALIVDEPTPNRSDFSYKDKKALQPPVTPVDAGNQLPEGDFSYTNKQASPAPVMAVGADEMTAEDYAEEYAACRKLREFCKEFCELR